MLQEELTLSYPVTDSNLLALSEVMRLSLISSLKFVQLAEVRKWTRCSQFPILLQLSSKEALSLIRLRREVRDITIADQKEKRSQRFYLSYTSAKGEGNDYSFKGRSPFNPYW